MLKRILKFLVAALLVLIVAVGAIALIYGRDSAPPPEISDLFPDVQPVPEDRNAFQHLAAAADTITLPPDSNMIVDYIQGKMIYDDVVGEIITKNEAVFPEIESALQFERCQAKDPENLDHIPKWYRIGLLLAMKAVHERQGGQLGLSTQSTITLLRFTDKIHPDARRLADFNPCYKMMGLALEQAMDTARMKEISREDLELFSDVLASLKPFGRGLENAFKYQFKKVANQIDGFRDSGKNLEETFVDLAALTYPLRKTTWFPEYLFKENETKQKLAEFYRMTIQNASKSSYADMEVHDMTHYFGLEGHSYRIMLKPNLVGKFFYALTTPEVYTFLETKIQIEGAAHAAQLIVALKMYEKDNGKLPEALSELIPKYLSHIPLDTFNNKPFLYKPEKGIIYSVSKDLKDSGGSTELPPGAVYGPEYPRTWIALDAVFNIN